ncbi:hypothetical protein ACS0ZG_33390 [Burkholderia gladioli]|uniref:hypothetical protein n=1 Tax=Burkholderia gladioli TaxID=28095 RepID=UPI003F7919F4
MSINAFLIHSIQGARRHGVRVLPVDVTGGRWVSTLEVDTTAALHEHVLISSIRAEVAGQFHRAQAPRLRVDVADLARRAALDRYDRTVLAHAGALR